jgi:general secretion pathway protein J
MRSLQNSGGFTLIEILTAVFVLSVMVSLVLGSFGSLFDDADHVNMGTDLHEMGNACMDRISNDLKSIHVSSYPRYRPPDIDDDPELYHIKGETRNVGGDYFTWLRFTSAAHLPFNQSATEGIAEIVYYAQQTPENEIILRRADNLYPYPEEFEENETDPVMCEQVRKFELVYYDNEGDEHELWDSESDDMEYSTPRAIGLKLVVGTEENSYAFTSRTTLPAYRYKKVKK